MFLRAKRDVKAGRDIVGHDKITKFVLTFVLFGWRRRDDEQRPVPIEETSTITPYLIDRKPQRDHFFDRLTGLAGIPPTPGRPIVCIIHGYRDELCDKLVERLTDLELEPERIVTIKPKFAKLDWPRESLDGNSLSERCDILKRDLGQIITGKRKTSKEEIEQAIKNAHQPVIVGCSLRPGDWGQDAKQIVEKLLDTWREAPDHPEGSLVLQFLCLDSNSPTEDGAQVVSAGGELAGFVDAYCKRFPAAVSFIGLPELLGILEGDFLDWSASKGSRICDKHPRIRQLVKELYLNAKVYRSCAIGKRISLGTLVAQIQDCIDKSSAR